MSAKEPTTNVKTEWLEEMESQLRDASDAILEGVAGSASIRTLRLT